MELKVVYKAYSIPTDATLMENELFMSVTKAEAFEVCRDVYVYYLAESNPVVEKVLARAEKKARSKILSEQGLHKNQYKLEIDLRPDESNLFTNSFIKEFFKWILKDAYEKNPKIFEIPGFYKFFQAAIDTFEKHYDGNLHVDTVAIKQRVIPE